MTTWNQYMLQSNYIFASPVSSSHQILQNKCATHGSSDGELSGVEATGPEFDPARVRASIMAGCKPAESCWQRECGAGVS